MKDSNFGTSKFPSRTEVRLDEDIYRSIFNDVMIGMAIMDPETKLWVEVNDRFCDMFVYRREELHRMT